MLYRSERERDGPLRLQAAQLKENESPVESARSSNLKHLSEIDECIEGFRTSLWPLNRFIHANPELAFREYKAHNTLTEFLRMQDGWKVTPSAYGMETAWVASYDSGQAGPAVSFNVEMGTLCRYNTSRGISSDILQMRFQVWVMHVATIS
jgi:metal-dependent amidase/aminoacylase/carboxypeptidase family protein